MPMTSITTDASNLTLTAIGDFEVPVERLWTAWADPRQLERFWGPPTWPATFTRHDVREGGESRYYMTGPKGETSHGYWHFDAVVPLQRFAIRDGFAHADGTANADYPETRMEVRFEATAKGSRFIAISTFASIEAMEMLVSMGMVEGLSQALGQLEQVLDDLRAFAADRAAALEVIDDTHIVVRRVVRGSIDLVWRAHHDERLMRRWMLGPDGWRMPVCDVATKVGDRYRFEWEHETDGQRFGFVGELLESEAPRRAVTTEQMIGMDGPGAVNELLLSPRPGGKTLIEVRIQYPSKEVRDMVIGSGMVDGMEMSYARLETVVAAEVASAA